MSDIIIYKTPDNQTQVEVQFEGETVWATQRQMAEIFDTTPQNITLHLKKVYKDGEIEEPSTCKEYLQVQTEGKRKVKRKQLIYKSVYSSGQAQQKCNSSMNARLQKNITYFNECIATKKACNY